VAVFLGIAVYLVSAQTLEEWLAFLDEDLHPALFVSLMAVLPSLGAPISVFLVIAGVKFGIVWALVITSLIMPLHFCVGFVVARSFLRPHVRNLLLKRGYELPAIPKEKYFIYTFVPIAIPGPPYAAKNYLLPMAGAPFWHFFGISWVVQLGLAVPFIGAGDSAARMNWWLSGAFIGIFLLIYFGVSRVKKGLSGKTAVPER
jgi:uncharacterized membrane protein YdjX (TVP38/TMEM64 family)